jgi:Domain of Unknown Function (DUF748)
MAHTSDHPASRLAFFRRHRGWTLFGLTIVVLLLMIFFVLPIGVRWGIEKWLESHGQLQARVQDVDFNLFSGYMVVNSLLAERAGKGGFKWVQASLEIAWRPFFKKHIRVNDVSVTNASLRLVQEGNGALYVGGFRVNPGTGAAGQKHAHGGREKGWEIGFGNIDLKNVLVHFEAPGFERQMVIRQAHIDPMQTWNPSSAGGFSAELAVGDGTIHIQGTAKPYSRKASVQGRLQIRKLPLAWADPWLKKRAIRNVGGTLAADGAFSVSVGAQTEASLSGTLRFDQIKADLPQANISPLTLSWDGNAQVIVSPKSGRSPRIHANGTLSAHGSVVQLTAKHLSTALQSLRFQGDFQSNTEGVPKPDAFLFSGAAEAGKIRVWRSDEKTSLVQIAKLSADKLRVTGTKQVQIETVEATQGDFLERPNDGGQHSTSPQYVLSFAALTVRHVSLDAGRKHLAIGAVDLGGVHGYLVRDQAGKLKIIDQPPPAGDGQEQVNSHSTRPSAAWSFAVDQAAIGRESALRFVDHSVTPPVDLTASNIQIGIEHLNSVSNQPVSLHLGAKLGKYAPIDAQGTIIPLAQKINMDIHGHVKQFSLPDLRGYVRQKLGYTIKSGQLYADFHLLVDRDRMDSVIKLFVTELNLNRLSQSQLGPMEHELGMPLNTALNLLRDRHRNIRLRLPVTGSWAKPHLEMGGVIAKAVRSATYKAIKTAALSYFAPLGAAYVAGKLFGKLVALRLNPIDFAAGQGQLDPKDKQYLDQVAEKMKDRPGIRLLICGKAAESDRQAFVRAENPKNQSNGKKEAEKKKAPVTDAELLKLARNRAENTRTYLVGKGIDSGRLVVCAPEIASGQNEQPRVELAV